MILVLLGFINYALMKPNKKEHHRKTKPREIIGKVISLLLSVLMVFGSVMINKGYSTLDDITNSNTKSTHYAIVVLKSSKINSLSELQNESIEYCLQYDEEKDMNEVIAEAKKKEYEIDAKGKEALIEAENKVSSEDEDKVVGLIEIKQNEFDILSDEVDKFNFYEKDNAEKEKLINDIESQIKYANTEHYNIKYEINKIENSLTTGIDLINIDDINELYKEVEIFFPDALLEEYEKVVNFNKEITSERNQYLSENLATLKQELIEVETQLKKLENEKSVIWTKAK